MITLKLSDEDSAKYGITDTSSLTSALGTGFDAIKKASEDETALAELEADLKANQVPEPVPLPQPPATDAQANAEVIRKELLGELKAEVGKQITSALAKSGGAPTAATANTPSDVTNEGKVKKVADDDYEGQWAANEKALIAEGFEDASHYAAYQKAYANGQAI